ncbi:maintenance of mitochondrial structure and function-domain-containing protein [Thamnocephalis sphaerospora]|uniref:Eukaryotic translation initiation factor 3 subunit F n=1 Tax=Thamnocephalis sphaerospora TaxID=78915 RepID=A0A4P9XWD0_9FUNG|nr:maintenance of mitochondrial structure and function-domain-containing protein [Thamnocephalis sphaerospora]|eukprot:RKP10342.1 maintenance of mitochondrial structure and function-domain-containing protein [Thamnocephalis sphaerospora]
MATSLPTLNLALPVALTTPSLSVSPVVLFTVLDHYLRRDSGQRTVVGTLLGVRSEDGRIVEVRSAFPVPFDGKAKKAQLDMDYHRTMFGLHQRVNQKEVVVGWYATGKDIINKAAEIQELYAAECPHSPVHLLLDTQLTGDRLGLKAFYSAPVGLAQKAERSLLTPIPCEIRASDAERSGLDLLAQARGKEDRSASLSSDLDNLERSVHKVQALLSRTIAYVDSVLSGATPMDAAVGRRIMDAVAAVPKIDEASFETAFNDHLQDQLMVIYLANMTRAQVSIAESVHTLI